MIVQRHPLLYVWMAETNRWTRASPIHPATHPRTHCQPTGPGAMQLFGKLRVLYRSSWLACVFLLHRRRLSRLGATTRERLRKGEGGERKTCLCAVARPLLYSSDCRCGLPPVAPSDLAEIPRNATYIIDGPSSLKRHVTRLRERAARLSKPQTNPSIQAREPS